MAKLKLSKNSLQQQQLQLKLYRRLLPSLDLKRRQLTTELQKARSEYQATQATSEFLDKQIGQELPMLADSEINLSGLVRMVGYQVGEQNVVGIRVPVLEHAQFVVTEYSRFTTPVWVDLLVQRLKDASEARVRTKIAGERVKILEQATRKITQRVNLFEKILIPTSSENIQKIRISLGDAERAAVVASKLSKAKQQSGMDSFAEEAV